HLPFCAPAKYWDLYERSKLQTAKFTQPPQDAPRYAGKTLGELNQYKPIPQEGPLSVEMTRTLIHGYYASLSYMDAQIGRVIDELERLQLQDDTIIVLWGDHGYHLGDHGSWTKHTNYEQANRIPLVIVAPGTTRAGTSNQSPVETVDIYPTLCELAGLPPTGTAQPIDGESLVPILNGTTDSVSDHAYHCFPKGGKLGRAIRTKRYRMVEWKPFRSPAPAEYELYDYQNDPLEKKNIAAQNPKILEDLKKILKQHPPAMKPRR
ncbi:sulfatase-like hydrolase/transferase, partial [bacterium]|nr:sulfatase-like hydrolase/transferase [bacterium]